MRVSRADVHKLPFPDLHFDTVVATLVFCSVRDPAAGMKELFRVLRPGGSFCFMEHGLPENRPRLRHFLKVATPSWKWVADGCHLNRQPIETIRETGFLVWEKDYFYRGVFVMGTASKPGSPD